MSPFRIPNLKESLHFFGDPTQDHLCEELRVLVWNVYKGKRGSQWQKDFLRLSMDRDLILLQEVMADKIMPQLWKAELKEFQWKMATSFEYQHSQHKTGVATGARFLSHRTEALRGSARELFFWTPKITLSSVYQTLQREFLLVINTHVVNFTVNRSFHQYIDEILQKAANHQGPLIFAGDFNTWSFRRWSTLVRALKEHELQHVRFPKDPRTLKLDHIFVRGLEVAEAKVLNDVTSSDHKPLEVKLRLNCG